MLTWSGTLEPFFIQFLLTWSPFKTYIEQYVKFYGKNNLYVVSVDQAFDAFLQKCNFIEALPGGLVQFTGMTAAIIQDIYHIDLNDIKHIMREMDSEVIPSDEEAGPSFCSQECGLKKDELRDLQ